MLAQDYDQKYIEHEVQLRVLKETTESKFVLMQKNSDDKFAHMDYKINLIIGIAVISLLVPLIKTVIESVLR